MKLKKILATVATVVVGTSFVLAGCSNSAEGAVEEQTTENKTDSSKGVEYTNILSGTNWQGTTVKDAAGNDLTSENASFIGLAKYDADTNYYEFFDKETKATRDDEGTFFVTADGTKRILISTSKNYQAVVDLTEVTKDKFTYKRQGVDKDGKDVEVFVEHIPYTDSQLEFTHGRDEYTTSTGTIDTAKPGREILGERLWNGTVVKDADGNDVTEANKMFISLAKFDATTNKYEFFNIDTGQTRGDYGYYDVIDHNKLRAHVSIGQNKYGAVLEITELNPQRFTYKRMGKDASGKEIEVFVEHEPYTGSHNPTFSSFTTTTQPQS
jgi:predicted small secreted protein